MNQEQDIGTFLMNTPLVVTESEPTIFPYFKFRNILREFPAVVEHLLDVPYVFSAEFVDHRIQMSIPLVQLDNFEACMHKKLSYMFTVQPELYDMSLVYVFGADDDALELANDFGTLFRTK